MGIFDSIKNSVQEHFDKKKQDRAFEERIRLETAVQKKQTYEEDYRKHSLEIAKAQAHREAAEKSGMAKLRAQSRSRRLNEDRIEPGSFFEKLRDLTQKNKARTEANLKRTAEMREMGKKIQADRLNHKPLGNRPFVNKPFGNRGYIR